MLIRKAPVRYFRNIDAGAQNPEPASRLLSLIIDIYAYREKAFRFILMFYFPFILFNPRCVLHRETIRCMSAFGNDGVTRIGEPFHRA